MRLISTTARVAATKMSAAKTCQNWPAENPTLAAVLIQRTVMKAPAPTIRMLATQGASLPRIKVASRPVKPVGEPVPAAGPLTLASCFWLDRASATTAAIRPLNVAHDQCPEPPNPKNCTTVRRAPVLRYSHSITGGTASISTARPAVMVADQPTRRARRAPRPGLPDTSVNHQYPNSTSVIAAVMTGASHEVHALIEAVALPPDQVSTPCACSSQPQTWPSANSGARARMAVAIAPSSSDRTATSTVFASGAM